MNKKILIAIGIIALFAGMTLSPATANTTPTTDEITLVASKELTTEPLTFSPEELLVLDTFLLELTDELQKTTSQDQVLNVFNEFIRGYGRYPTIVALLRLFIKTVTFNSNLYQLSPLRQRAFILSWGFSNKVNPLKESQVDLYRPFTFWHYTGRSQYFLNSRTIIIDPYPFNIRMMDGRQIGFMRNFVGLYMYRRTLGDKDMTFFAGRAAGIIGFDFSFSVDGAW